MGGNGSVYAPYYSRIQGLLFEGMTIRQVHDYMEFFFGIYADIRTFYRYIKATNLQWYMPIQWECGR